MKKLPAYMALALSLSLSAQEKKTEIPVKQQITEYEISDGGTIYFQFADIRMQGMAGNKRVQVYDPEFKLTDEISLDDAYKRTSIGILSQTGRFLGFIDLGVSTLSDQSVYYRTADKFKKFKDNDNQGPLTKIFHRFATDNSHIYFGKNSKVKDKEFLDGHEYDGLFLRVRDLQSFAIKQVPIVFPAEAAFNGKLFYQYIHHDNDKVYFLLNAIENGTTNHGMLVSYDYDGRLIDKTPFKITVPQGKVIKYFSNPYHFNSVEMAKGGVINEVWSEGATVKAVIDKDAFYIMGTRGAESERERTDDGFYVYKFDFDGNLKWKIDRDLAISNKKEKSKAMYGVYNFDIALLNNGKIALWKEKSLTDKMSFFEINEADGTILNEKQEIVLADYKSEMSPKKGYGGLSKSNYIFDSESKNKNRYDFKTLYAIQYNPQVKEYVESRKKSRFESYIDETGIYMIEENDNEDMYTLLHF